MITGLRMADETTDVSVDDLTLDQIEWLRGELHRYFVQFVPIWDLTPISTRLKNSLLRSAKKTLRDVIETYPEHWATMPWIGPSTYRELRQVVAPYGVVLPEKGKVAA